ncbi:MAG: undecaprenyl-diphosphate phosphatase [Candidatus Portnoybacteria bacterium]|nr:undecaprenyl-diphosphate phosphatase [Candidatus Portnoybacteria bacterium]
MLYIDAVILSIIEGLTEFLPISSTGHLILASDILKISQTDFVKSFEIFIQLGAILAVIVLYGKMLLKNTATWKPIIIAFLPTAVIGFAFYSLIKRFLLGNIIVTLLALFIGGLALIVIEKLLPQDKGEPETIEKITAKKAFLIGLCQSISMIPGVSRSAATILGGLFLGLKRKMAVEFSFLLAIPTMFAATGFDIIKSDLNFSLNEFWLLAIGFIGSFITALLAIKFFIRFIQRHTFVSFGAYRIILAILFWLFIIKL